MSDTQDALKTWIKLNDALRSANEVACQDLLRAEAAGKRRSQFMSRIYSRFNKVRAVRERAELQKQPAQ